MRSRPLRPFCRDEHNGHVCHRMLGHAGPHVERHDQAGDDRSSVEWFTTVDGPLRPASVHAERLSPQERPSVSNTTLRRL